MVQQEFVPKYNIVYGPDANCTLALCPVEASVYEYRPSLGGNITFLLLFAIALFLHTFLAIRWRTFSFGFCMFWGCVTEIIGYGGRLLLWQNPFSFAGFLMQIICIALGPAFFSAAIYFTLSKIIAYLGPTHARFPPKFYYWFFIPCDILSLTLQACGGALSSTSSGSSKVAVHVSVAGLSFQVFTLCIFIGLAIEYLVRYRRAPPEQKQQDMSLRFKIFVSFLSVAIVLILIRCAYRIDELSDGYSGPLIHNEGLFVGLEGVMIVVAVFCLAVAQPGPVFGWPTSIKGNVEEAGMVGVTGGGREKTSLERDT